jgi:hypothetical protein
MKNKFCFIHIISFLNLLFIPLKSSGALVLESYKTAYDNYDPNIPADWEQGAESIFRFTSTSYVDDDFNEVFIVSSNYRIESGVTFENLVLHESYSREGALHPWILDYQGDGGPYPPVKMFFSRPATNVNITMRNPWAPGLSIPPGFGHVAAYFRGELVFEGGPSDYGGSIILVRLGDPELGIGSATESHQLFDELHFEGLYLLHELSAVMIPEPNTVLFAMMATGLAFRRHRKRLDHHNTD